MTTKQIIIIILASLILGVCSPTITAEIAYEKEYWQLTNVSDIELEYVDTEIYKFRGEYTLNIKIKDHKRDKMDEKYQKEFEKYPINIYYKTLKKDGKNPYIVNEHLKLIDSYTVNLLEREQHIPIKNYRERDRIVMKIGKHSITYNAGSDRIIILQEAGMGDSWANAINFTWIYEMDQLNGWNQMERIGTNSFHVKCRLQLGNYSTGIYFDDRDKLVEFERDKDMLIYNGWFKLGDILNQSSKVTGNGCNIILNTSLYRYIYFYKANVYIYDSNFKQLDSEHGQFYLYAWSNRDIRFWGTKINNFYSIRNYGLYDVNEEVWYDTVMKNCTYGIQTSSGDYPPSFTDKLSIYNSKNAFYLSWVSYPMEVKNSKCVNIREEEIYVYRARSPIYFIDCEFEKWSIKQMSAMGYYWILHRQNTFNLLTTPKAKVTIHNNTSIIYQDVVDSNGYLLEQIFSSVTWDNYVNYHTIEKVDHNPFTIKISRPGYHTFAQSFNITDPINWTIMLEPIKETHQHKKSSGLTMVAGLMICAMVLIVSKRKG